MRPADETLLARWLRRAGTVPGVLLAGALFTVLFPVSVTGALLVDLVQRRRLALTRTTVFALVWFWSEAIGLLCAFTVWLVTLRWLGIGREAFVSLSYRLQETWAMTLWAVGEKLFGFSLRLEGEIPLAGTGPLLVLVRHASTLDTVLPLILLGYQRGWRPRYVVKRELLLDPCIDTVCQRFPYRFVHRGGEQTAAETERVVGILSDLSARDAVIVYPEGTRFSRAKREHVIARLASHGPSPALDLARELQNTLPPLRKGSLALLANNPAADLLVLAHVGLEATATLASLVDGSLVGSEIRVRARRVPFAAIPTDPEGQQRFLADLWRDVDRFVADHGPAFQQRPEESAQDRQELDGG
jgi:1-acyl-sn-glycerol-3-phosphate acyltransferase